RLKEQAYRQSRLGSQMVVASTSDGYGLLVDHRAIDLLRRIQDSLAMWEAIVAPLITSVPDLKVVDGVAIPARRRFDTVDAARARFLAEHVKTIRLRCSSAYNMHLDMLSFAKQAYNVINRPPDNFCGPCPTQRPADE